MIINKELANKIKSKTLNEYGIKIEDKVYLEQNDVLSIIEDLLVEIGNSKGVPLLMICRARIRSETAPSTRPRSRAVSQSICAE